MHTDPTSHHSRSLNNYRLYLCLFLFAIGVRSLFLIFIDEPVIFSKYPYFAEKLAKGESIGERLVDLSPFYLYFLTLLKTIFNLDWTVLKVIQSLIGVITCLLLFNLGTHLFCRDTGFLSALLYAVYGNLIILESTLEPTVFVLLFNLMTALFMVRAADPAPSERYRSIMIVCSGICCGLSIITKPNFLLFLPIGVCFLLSYPSQTVSMAMRIRQSIIFIGLSTLLVLPISVRNLIEFKEFILITADAGKVFYHGSGKSATALEGVGLLDEGFMEEGAQEPDFAHALYRKKASELTGEKLSPSESSKYWFRKTFSDIMDDPRIYLKRQMKKFFYFFNDYEMHYIASAYMEYKRSIGYPFVRFGVIISLAALGMILSIKAFRHLPPVYGMIFLYLFSGLVFLVQSRYRLPAVPYFCLFAGYAVLRLKETISLKRFKQFTVYLLIITLTFISVRFVFRGEINNMERWQEATKIDYLLRAKPAFLKGDCQQAMAHLARCLALAPRFSPAYNMRGKCHALLGDHQMALDDFNTVIRLSPAVPEGYKNAGFTHLLLGQENEAKALLQKAASLAPHDGKIIETLRNLAAPP